jgi:hypothetical protein
MRDDARTLDTPIGGHSEAQHGSRRGRTITWQPRRPPYSRRIRDGTRRAIGIDMNLRSSGLAIVLAVLAACTGGESTSNPDVAVGDPRAYSVSYRNPIRLPNDGAALSALGFANQARRRDPIAPVRCLAEESDAFRDITNFLGGIPWAHPVSIIKDATFPPLYTAKRDLEMNAAPSAGRAEGADGSAAPVIERPDLVGVQNGIAIFLSKQHGLLAIDTRAGAPTPSCTMKLPGEPKNFLFKGNEVVVVVNARGFFNRAALLRYSFEGANFRYIDSIRLEGQNIQDARLFDSTIVAYTSWTKSRNAPAPPPDEAPPAPTTPDYMRGGTMGGAARSDAAPSSGYGTGERLGAKLIVAQWDDRLDVDWQDSLLDDPVKQDPLEGVPADKKYTQVGELISERKTYKSFVAASDRYIAIPRDVQKTLFAGYETYNYQVCTSYNPHASQVESCYVNYERRPNPDYRPPNPTTGDYACGGKKLADCIQQAAPTISQYINVPVSQKCDMVWVGRCEKYETKSVTYPRFTQENATELTIYRFEKGSFTKLDSTLGKMVQKPAQPDALTFEIGPLSVSGALANRNQIQFQNGHLYIFGDNALQTMAVAGNSVSYINRLSIEANTNNPAIVFSTDRAMISSSTYNRSSDVEMLNLATPALPQKLTSFQMPGTTTQLILTANGILGPGQVDASANNVSRSLQKLTLFSRENGQELDNLLLGTEYDTFESSWFDGNDDQKIRFGGQRLFLPYSGRHHADPYEPIAHRINISRIENNRLVSEHSFNVDDDVVRTASIDDNHAVVFSNSATYWMDRTSGDWAIRALREFFTPFATYRLNDDNLFARVDRVGSKCRISTHAGDADIFAGPEIAKADISCPEGAFPIGFGSSLLFAQTRTGVRISPDGKTIEPLAPADVEAMVQKTQLPDRGYCYIASPPDTAPALVEFLDSVPAKIFCEAPKSN